MWCFIAGLSEKKIRTLLHMFYNSVKSLYTAIINLCSILIFAVIIAMMETSIEAKIMQKLKNKEPRPKFTGSYKKYVFISRLREVTKSANLFILLLSTLGNIRYF